MEEALQKLYGQPDDIGRFIQEVCEEKSGARTPLKALHEAYTAWAEKEGLEAVGNILLGKELERRGYEKYRSKAGVKIVELLLRV